MVLFETRAGHLIKPVIAFAESVSKELTTFECKRTVLVPDIILDVGITIGIRITIHISIGKSFSSEVPYTVGIHKVGRVTGFCEFYPTVISNLTFAHTRFLGSDDNHTVGTARTIKRRCRSILENLDRFNIIYVNRVERAVIITHNQTVNHIYRA